MGEMKKGRMEEGKMEGRREKEGGKGERRMVVVGLGFGLSVGRIKEVGS